MPGRLHRLPGFQDHRERHMLVDCFPKVLPDSVPQVTGVTECARPRGERASGQKIAQGSVSEGPAFPD